MNGPVLVRPGRHGGGEEAWTDDPEAWEPTTWIPTDPVGDSSAGAVTVERLPGPPSGVGWLRWATAATVCLAVGAAVGAWWRDPDPRSVPVVTTTVPQVVTMTPEVLVVEDAWGGVIPAGVVPVESLTPGRYLAVRSDPVLPCRWRRLVVTPTGGQQVVAEDETIGSSVATIAETDDLFWSWGCHWRRDG